MNKYWAFTFLFLIFGNSRVVAEPDSLKFSMPSSIGENLNENIIKQLQEAIMLIQSDSIRIGIVKLSNVYSQINNMAHYGRVFDYNTVEIYSFLKLIENRTLNDTDDKLLMSFFSSAFKNDLSDFQKDLHKLSKKECNSELCLRLNAFISNATNSANETNVYLNDLLSLYPRSLSGNLLRATIYYKQKKWSDCKIYFTRVISIDSNYSYAYSFRAWCNYQLNFIDEAECDYEKSIELFPKYADALNELGVVYIYREKWDSALGVLKKAFEYKSTSGWVCNNLGLTYYKTNQNDSAIKYLDLAINLEPNDENAYINRGDVYNSLDKNPRAIFEYSRAIEINPNRALSYVSRGDAYTDSKDYNNAIQDYQKAIKIDPEYHYAFKRIADCYYEQQNYLNAIKFCNEALTIKHDYYQAIFRKAISFSKLKNYKQAIEEYQKIIIIDPKYYDAYGGLGWEYYCKNDFLKCIEYSNLAISLNEKAYYAKFNIALATLRMGKIDEAKALYVKYYNECIKDNELTSGAIDDLNELISKGIMSEDAKFILNNIFKNK